MSEFTEEVKRLKIVFDDSGLTIDAFAAIMGIHRSSMSRMLSGKTPVTLTVTKAVCYKLGYAPVWFITGKGNKKVKDDPDNTTVNLVTEITMLRTEMNIMFEKIKMHDESLKKIMASSYYDAKSDATQQAKKENGPK